MISILMAASTAAAAMSPLSGPAGRLVSDFVATCGTANGDFEAMKRAAKSAGFREKSYLKSYPLSLYATRKSHILVYRGAFEEGSPLRAPQCSVQTDHIPGGDFEKLGLMVQSGLGLPEPEKSKNPTGRPVLKWVVERGSQPMVIALADDRLLGQPNLRLTILPRDDPGSAQGTRQKVIEVNRD